jgi:hypothetical protein
MAEALSLKGDARTMASTVAKLEPALTLVWIEISVGLDPRWSS